MSYKTHKRSLTSQNQRHNQSYNIDLIQQKKQ